MTEEQNRTLQDKFMLRLPDGMRDRIKQAAERNNRSMNAEIVATLEDKYPVAFSFDVFNQEWLAPILLAKDKSLKEHLAAKANQYLKSSHPDYSVRLEENMETGQIIVWFGVTEADK